MFAIHVVVSDEIMNIEMILDCSKNSSLIAIEGNVKDVVIGVPHHAPLGTEHLPCKDHRNSDENTGQIGYQLSKLLNCGLIVASNYHIDSNKSEHTDYFKMLKLIEPKILIEIHGHGEKSAKFHIEISSGDVTRNHWSIELANRLRRRLKRCQLLCKYSISGDFNKIKLKAKKSKTISEPLTWIPFHIELPKSLRADNNESKYFSKLLSKSINSLVTDFIKPNKEPNAAPEEKQLKNYA